MRISASSGYRRHSCDALWVCDRLYCPVHRLLFRTCESFKDLAPDGPWFTNECPACREEFQMQEAIRKWKSYEDTLCEHGFNKLVAPPDFGACYQCYPERKTA